MGRRRRVGGPADEVVARPLPEPQPVRDRAGDRLLALQQGAGNAAVTSLLRPVARPPDRDRPGPVVAPGRVQATSVSRSILQRHEDELAEPTPAGRSILAVDRLPRQARDRAGGPVQRQAKAITYPAYRNVSFNSTVRSANWKAWRETVKATTKTSRREQGHWVQWDITTSNNANGTYKIAGASVGPSIANTAGAAMTPTAKPADKGDWHTVGYFHTHTPTRFRAVGRGVGPSTADETFHTGQNVTGIVRDYRGVGGNIPKGHPLWGASRYYHTGPNRRT